jgi:hypothetical protein
MASKKRLSKTDTLGHGPIKRIPKFGEQWLKLPKEFAMARFDLTNFEWSVIQPLLPNKPRGVARADDRRVLNGIFWRLRTGARPSGAWLRQDGRTFRSATVHTQHA